MRKPSSIPRPRNDCDELRLALSYEDLKMNGTRKLAQVSLSRPATSIWSCSDSTTQGPAMRNRGRSRPASNPQRFIGQLRDELRPRARRLAARLARSGERRVDVGDEKRVAAPRVRGELGVILAAEEPRMVGELDHLAQVAGQRALGPRADDQTGGFEPREIMVVYFVTVAMALGPGRCAVDAVRERPGNDLAGLRAEAHGAAEVGLGGSFFDGSVLVLPFGNECHHRMRRIEIELGAVGVGEPRLVPRILDHRELHAEANPQIGNPVLARIADRFDLALDSALAKTSG